MDSSPLLGVVLAKHGAKEYYVGILFKHFTGHSVGVNYIDTTRAGCNRACDGVPVGGHERTGGPIDIRTMMFEKRQAEDGVEVILQ